MDDTSNSLEHIPPSISMDMLPRHIDLSQKCIWKAANFVGEAYVHDIKIHISNGKVIVGGSCYRSMRKNENPYKMSIDITGQDITDASFNLNYLS